MVIIITNNKSLCVRWWCLPINIIIDLYTYILSRGPPSKVLRCSSNRQWLVANRGKRVAPICDRRGAADTESRSHGNMYMYGLYNLSVLPPPPRYLDLISVDKLKNTSKRVNNIYSRDTSQIRDKSPNSHGRKHPVTACDQHESDKIKRIKNIIVSIFM